jgi:hypothetical protein
MLIPTDVMGVYRALKEDTFYIRDLRTGQMQPTGYTTFQQAVDAQYEAEQPADATEPVGGLTSPLYIATNRQVNELSQEVASWDQLLKHPMLNAPEVPHV